MSVSFQSPALQFEIIAKCSVSTSAFSSFHVYGTELIYDAPVDHESSRVKLNTPAWTSLSSYVYACSYPSLPERPYSCPTGSDRMQSVPEQYISFGAEARARHLGEDRGCPHIAGMEWEHPDG